MELLRAAAEDVLHVGRDGRVFDLQVVKVHRPFQFVALSQVPGLVPETQHRERHVALR